MVAQRLHRTRRTRVGAPLVCVLFALVVAALAAPSANAHHTFGKVWLVVKIRGAGSVQDHLDDKVFHSANCTSPATTPTGALGKTCGPLLWNWSWVAKLAPTPAAGFQLVEDDTASGWHGLQEWIPSFVDGHSGHWAEKVFCDGADENGWYNLTRADRGVQCWFQAWGSLAVEVRFVDRQDPVTTIDSGPNGNVTGDSRAEFGFHSSQIGSKTKCSLDGALPTDCTSPATYTGLASGMHTFAVHSIDPSQNEGDAATRTWTVDVTPPQTILDSASPPAVTSSAAATFTFHQTDEHPGGFDCSLDEGAFAACSSPASYSSLGEGPHTFLVRARDALGNPDGTPAQYTWVIDTGPPDTLLTPSGPAEGSVTASTSATFSFTAEPGSTFQCRLDGGSFGVCSGPGAFHSVTGLESGAHVFEVRATDAVGNIDATPASRRWTVDAVPPDTVITGGPADGSTSHSGTATFAFGSEPGASFECKIDGGAFGVCSAAGSHTVSGLGNGAHTFQVRAIDGVGNVDWAPASRTWTVALPAMSLSGAAFNVTWQRSTLRPNATMRLAGTVTGGQAGELTITLRHRRLQDASATLHARVAAGTFAVRLPLPASALKGVGLFIPGEYSVEVAGTAGGYPIAARAGATMPTPREGVVVSSRIVASPRKISARFGFAPEALPSATVRAVWLDPRGKIVGNYQVRPPNAVTWFRWLDNRSLAKGKWTCQVRVGKTIVKSVSIRVS